MSESKREYVSLFFKSLKMMCLRGFDIGPYEEKLSDYERELDREREGLESNQISYRNLYEYVESINLGTYGLEKEKKREEKRTSYLLTNYITGRIVYVCFYNCESGDIAINEATGIVDRIQRVSACINGHSESVHGLSLPDSIMDVILITSNKISSYPKERIANIKEITVISKDVVMAEPFNNVFQSEFKIASESTRKELENISASKMPSSFNDSFTKYMGLKGLVEIYRDEGQEFASNKLHYKIVG